ESTRYMRGRRFSPAMRWARNTFLQVIGKKAPAFTVASLAMTMRRRPATVPMPVTTPADGALPHSWYIFHAAHRPSSKNAGPRAMAPAGGKRAFLVLPRTRLGTAAVTDLFFLTSQLG